MMRLRRQIIQVFM
nr:unnamed protein product [Callosobruchus analis]